MNRPRTHRFSVLGFNTCEIAVICAFIAIFAMAALPRFGEAQLRADTTRVQRDLASMAAAMEAYRADYGSYPSAQGTYSNCDTSLLTTPMAYASSLPVDVFRLNAGISCLHRVYGVAYVASMPSGYIRSYNTYPRTSWMTWSLGPDFLTNTGGYFSLPAIIANEASPSPGIGVNFDGMWITTNHTYSGMRYDPTNGTASFGDIYRFGREATWRQN